MVDACCMWCVHARKSRGACGIICGMNGFIHEDGSCPTYEPIAASGLAQVEIDDYGEDITAMANAVKWSLREIGGAWPLLGAAVIDRLQEIAEKAEMWEGEE